MATFVKKIIVGTPVKRVTSGTFSLFNIDGVIVSGGGVGHGDSGDILVYSAARDEYLNTNTLTDFRVGQMSFRDDSITAGANPVVFSEAPEIKNPLNIFDSADLTTKIYVDNEVEKVKHVIFTTDDNFTDSVHIYGDETIRVFGGNGITTSAQKIGSQYQLSVDLDSTGSPVGQFGSSTLIPVITIDQLGRVDSVGEVAVAGVQSFSYDSSSGLLTINTADGNSFTDSINLNPFTTNDLLEDSNLYYTRARFDSALGDTVSTQTIRSYFSASQDLLYDSTTGIFSVDVQQIYTSDNFDSDLDAAVTSSVDLQYDSTNNTFNLKPTTVTAGSYGSAVLVPTFTVDSDGRLQAAGEVSVAGVDSTSFDSATGIYTINTADGGQFDTYVYSQELTRTATVAGTGVHYDSVTGVVSIGQPVETTSDVIFGKVSADSINAGQIIATGNILPGGDSVYDLGDSVNRWKDIWLSGSTIHLGELTLTESDGNLKVTGPTDGLVDIYARHIDADSAYIRQLSVDSLNVSQVDLDSVHMNQLNVTSGDIDTLVANQLTSDSAFVSNLNVITGDIDTAVLGQVTIDSAYATQIDVASININAAYLDDNEKIKFGTDSDLEIYHSGTGAYYNNKTGSTFFQSGGTNWLNHSTNGRLSLYYNGSIKAQTRDFGINVLGGVTADSVTVTGTADINQLEVDSAYATQLNVVTGDIDTATLGQVTIDSAYATQLNVVTGDIDTLTSANAILDSADINTLSGSTIRLDKNGYLEFTPQDYASPPTYKEGRLWYNEDAKTLYLQGASDSVDIQIGEREWVRVRNNSAQTIPRGSPVYMTGVHIPGHPIHGHHPTVDLADASDVTKKDVMGLAAEEIAIGAHGYVIVRGYLDKINTSALTEGGRVHLGFTTPGTLVATAPEYPNYPMDVGQCLTADSAGAGGAIYVSIFDHTFERFRVTGGARVDGNVTIAGNLTVLGTQTTSSTANLSVSDTFIYLGGGDTIGAGGTNFTGTGLNDAEINGHFTGEATTSYYVRIKDSDGSGNDVIEFALDSDFSVIKNFDSDGTGTSEWNLSTDGLTADLRDNQTITFAAATGHTQLDRWYGQASPINVQIGIAGNYNNPADSYAHSGFFRDVSDQRWKFFQGYHPEPEGNINTSDPTFALAPIQFSMGYGNLTGNVTGQVSTLQNHNTDDLSEGSTNLYYTDARVDAAILDSIATNNLHVATSTIDSATITTLTRSGATDYSGVWGSSSLVPIITVDASGFIDSIGTTSVAGVSSTAWDSTTSTYTISTADGGSFATIINRFDSINVSSNGFISQFDADSAKIGSLSISGSNIIGGHNTNISASFGVNLQYNGSNKVQTDALGANIIGNLDVDSINATNITADSGGFTNLAVGTLIASQMDFDSSFIDNLNVNTATIVDLDVDSASIGNFEVSGNAIKNSNDTFSIENRASATKKHITIDNYSSGGDINLRVWDGSQLREGIIIDGDVVNGPVVNLYGRNNSTKLQTKNLGVTVFGTLDGDSATFTGNVDAATFSGDGSSLTNVPAVTVGGVSASSFLRSDAADTKTSGHLTFNDNVSAVFGTDADMYIGYNGADNYVDVQRGNLYLLQQANDKDIALQTDNGSGGTTNYLVADGSTGEVQLYHYGSEKLKTQSTGVDITGEIIADSATLTSGNLRSDASYLNLYSGTAGAAIYSPDGSVAFEVNGDRSVMAYNGTWKVLTNADKVEIADNLDVDGNLIVRRVYNGVDSATTDYRIEQGTVSREYKNTGSGEDSSSDPIINLYVRTAAKTSNHRFYGSGSANGYYVAYDSDGLRTSREMEAPHLDFIPGRTYRFHTNDSSMSSHDIRFFYDNASYGATGFVTDSAADTVYYGTSGSGVPGSSYSQIRVKDDGISGFAYQCINHQYMGNSVTTNTTAGSRILGTTTGIKVDGDIEATIDGGTY